MLIDFDIDQLRQNAIPLKNIFLEHQFIDRYVDFILDSSHAKGSRQLEIIQSHVEWLSDFILTRKNCNFLDLGCGVGFYTNYLAERGHSGIGIDIMNKAIEHAQHHYASENCQFECADFLDYHFPDNLDCVLFVYSVYNTLSKFEAKQFLKKVFNSLKPGGVFYFEPFKHASYENYPLNHWRVMENSLFCQEPHLSLFDTTVDPSTKSINVYNYLLKNDGSTSSNISTIQLYNFQDHRSMLTEAGFSRIEFLAAPAFLNQSDDKDYMAIRAIK